MFSFNKINKEDLEQYFKNNGNAILYDNGVDAFGASYNTYRVKVNKKGELLPFSEEKNEYEKIYSFNLKNISEAYFAIIGHVNGWISYMNRDQIKAYRALRREKAIKEAKKRRKEKEKELNNIFNSLKNEYHNLPDAEKEGKLLLVDESRATGQRGGAIANKHQIFNFDAFNLKLSTKETEFLNNLKSGNIYILPKELSDPTSYKNFITYVMVPE